MATYTCMPAAGGGAAAVVLLKGYHRSDLPRRHAAAQAAQVPDHFSPTLVLLPPDVIQCALNRLWFSPFSSYKWRM